MPTWAIVTLVLGTSAISSVLTFLITKIQVRHSDKRLEKELQRQRDAESRQSRWEVRSEPLLKLRAELAYMAAMLNRAISIADGLKTLTSEDKARAEEELEKAGKDWNDYFASRFNNVIFIQSDEELFNKVREIKGNYVTLLEDFMQQRTTVKTQREIWPMVLELQELLNKRLEEL